MEEEKHIPSRKTPAFEWQNLTGQGSMTDTKAAFQNSKFLTCSVDPKSRGCEHCSCQLHCSKYFSAPGLFVQWMDSPCSSIVRIFCIQFSLPGQSGRPAVFKEQILRPYKLEVFLRKQADDTSPEFDPKSYSDHFTVFFPVYHSCSLTFSWARGLSLGVPMCDYPQGSCSGLWSCFP